MKISIFDTLLDLYDAEISTPIHLSIIEFVSLDVTLLGILVTSHGVEMHSMLQISDPLSLLIYPS